MGLGRLAFGDEQMVVCVAVQVQVHDTNVTAGR